MGYPGDPPLFCTRCQLAAYCSKECQQKDWKNHKKHCIPCQDHKQRIRAERTHDLLQELLENCSGTKMFSVPRPLLGELPNRPIHISALVARSIDVSPLVASPQEYTDFSSVLRYIGRFPNTAPVIYFRSPEECEKFVATSIMILRDTLPLTSRSRLPRLASYALDKYPETDGFAMSVRQIILENTENTSTLIILVHSGTDGGLTRVNLTLDVDRGIPAFGCAAAAASSRLAYRIEFDPAFRCCRKWIRTFIQDNTLGPYCVILMYNLFKNTPAFYRRDLKRVTPERLLEALQRQDGLISIQKLRGFRNDRVLVDAVVHAVKLRAEADCYHTILGIFSTYLHSLTNVSFHTCFCVPPTDEIDDKYCNES
jgi:MYND finger